MNGSTASPDARRYRDTIGLLTTGVSVIVGRAGEEVFAMTANAVCSVSLEPMLVMFCPGKKTNFAQHVRTLSGFTVNVLRDDQQVLSTYFAGAWKEARPPPFRLLPSRCASRLEGCLATVDCELEGVTEIGDHWLVIGRVLQLHTGVPPHRPLLFFSGRYRALDVSESQPAPDLADVHDEPAHIFYDR
jgi:3-hydroxy-9,10-secoandrosta-1,3,5(10)-triene-9,17-dione monooxygenase reductase component